jgi:hypothetical protein
MARQLTEHDGRIALRDHITERASLARSRYGPLVDDVAIMRVLEDREIVRYPMGVRFDATPLQKEEFGFAMPMGVHPRDGFCLFIHPMFEQQRDLWPLLIAYHIPPVNYGDIADAADCELFGSVLLGMTLDAYYQMLCDITDSLPASPAP